MNSLRVKIFTADRKADLEKQMNEFLKTVPESFLRDLGFSHGVKGAHHSYSAMIVYAERCKPHQG